MKSDKTILKKDKIKILSSNIFPVVGVGASAGGLDAFKKLLNAIPVDSGMAYILVQHLDPNHESILSDLLQRATAIPVQEITDNIQVEPDHIYIIPANKLLTATDGILQLSARLPKNQKNLPIDVFFSSLAEVHQDHAIGVVLSGTASDGTLGLKAIKEHGGITIAQDQASAAYDGMPQSAIDAGVVDFILPPESIPQKLLALNKTFKDIPSNVQGNPEQREEEQFKHILSVLAIKMGVDFTYYKQATIRRRINRRIALSMKGNIGDYLLYLKESEVEQDMLYQDLLIPVTQFFRDNKVFEKLCEKIFPELLSHRSGNEPIRIWVAGCSTGQEAYSIAMCCQESIDQNASNARIQLFATDISEKSVAKARSGIYSKNEINGLSAARLQQFFTKTDGRFRLNKNIRDSCVFAYHNYLKDPPFAKIDLISCRNSLIYLEPFLQKKALTTFHYALKENGFLVLGKSETTDQAAELFNSFDKTNKFYTRKAIKGNFLRVLGNRKDEVFIDKNKGVGPKESSKNDFQKSGDDYLLSKYVPAGVIINEAMDIVQFRGATGRWLEPSSGIPNLNVLKMAREGLAFELRNAIHKVIRNKKPLIKENIPFQFENKERLVTIEVAPLPDTIEQYFLILFRDTPAPAKVKEEHIKGNKLATELDSKNRKYQSRIRELQKELAQTRKDMKSVTEDQEVANEELQSSNEELLSGSEELQSINEELDTSKEEIQTSNEELIIVNQELYDRNEQLNISRLFAESIVTTIREPLIIITKDFRVKTANKAFYDQFRVSEEHTIGKLLFELANKQWNLPDLRKMLEEMLQHKTNIEDLEITYTSPDSSERVMLLNASPIIAEQNDDQSILIAIEDVTEKRKIQKKSKLLEETLEMQVLDRTFALNEANKELQLSHENLEQFAYIASHDLQEPLRKISTFSSMLQSEHFKQLPEAVKELINKIRSSSDRMSILVTELLNFSKVLHAKRDFVRTDLDEILDQVIKDFELLIAEKKVVINRQTLPVINAIPFQINRLFYNLISNSIKFSKPGKKPVITITSKILNAEKEANNININPKFSYCEISVKDNGIGFKQQFSDRIFLVFQRLHSAGRFPGTGIGLAMCKTIVTNHYGDITAVSKENAGALFKILLPLNTDV